MNIVCVYSVQDFILDEKPLICWSDVPFGISFIASVLKEAGHNVEMQVFAPITPIYNRLKNVIDRFKPKMFCLSAVSSQMPIIRQIADTIKEISPSIFVVLGGYHPSLNPEESIQIPSVDAIGVGEGEKAIVELASQLERNGRARGIPNVWLKDDAGQIERNPMNPFIEDLDRLPFLDRDMWEPWILNTSTIQSILIGRGCPNRCTYCSNHAMAKITNGKYVRFRTPKNIISEIKNMLEKYPGVTEIYLEVETLGANIKYALELLSEICEFNKSINNSVKYGVNFAVNKNIANNVELFEALRRANFMFVKIGLESGSERVRSEILKRPKYTNQDIIDFCNLARRYSIDVQMNLLVGLPGETQSDFKDTVKCARECNPIYVCLSIFYPYPGTDLSNMAKEMGLLKSVSLNFKAERKKVYLDLPGFSKFQIKREYILIFYNVYKGKWPLSKIIFRTLIKAAAPYGDLKFVSFFKRMFYRRLSQLQNS